MRSKFKSRVKVEHGIARVSLMKRGLFGYREVSAAQESTLNLILMTDEQMRAHLQGMADTLREDYIKEHA